MLFTVLQKNYQPKEKRDEFDVIVSTQDVEEAIAEATSTKGDVRVKVDLDKKFGAESKEFTPIQYSESVRQDAMRKRGHAKGKPLDPWHGLREYVGMSEKAMKRALQNKVPGAFRDYLMELDEEERRRSRAPQPTEPVLANDQS